MIATDADSNLSRPSQSKYLLNVQLLWPLSFLVSRLRRFMGFAGMVVRYL